MVRHAINREDFRRCCGEPRTEEVVLSLTIGYEKVARRLYFNRVDLINTDNIQDQNFLEIIDLILLELRRFSLYFSINLTVTWGHLRVCYNKISWNTH